MIKTLFPLAYVFLIIVVSFTLSYVFYYFNKNTYLPKVIKKVLFFFRAIVLSILGFFLLQPYVFTQQEQKYPSTIVFALDASESVVQAFGKDSLQQLAQQLKQIKIPNTQVALHYFGGEVLDTLPQQSLKTTDFSKLFNYTNNAYPSGSLGALVVLSDGIINQGNPITQLAHIDCPVYPILIGDSSVQQSITIQHLIHNPTTYLNNEFPLEFQVLLKNYRKQSFQLEVYFADSLVQQKQISSKNKLEWLNHSTFIKAVNEGVHAIKIVVKNKQNQIVKTKTSWIKVLNQKKQLAFVYAQAHPDIAALKGIVKTNDQFEFKDIDLKKDVADQLINIDVLIIHGNIPPQNPIWKIVESKKINFLFIPNPFESYNYQNPYFTLHNNPNFIQEVFAYPNHQNAIVTLNSQKFNLLPPLFSAKTTAVIQGTPIPLLYSKIGLVETKQALLHLSKFDEQKFGVFYANGFWKWALQEVNTGDNKEKAVNYLMLNVLNFLSLTTQNDRLSVKFPENSYENEQLKVQAHYYDLNYQKPPNAQLTIRIQSDNIQRTASFNFVNQQHQVNVGNLPPGLYSYKVSALYQTDSLTVNGKFTVMEQKIELEDLEARWNDLAYLAKKQDGETFLPHQIKDLEAALKNQSYFETNFTKQQKTDLLDWWIFYVLVVLLLVLEWTFRRYYGE